MSNFIRGRALDSEARRLMALMHAGQSRAVSEGLPMVLWVDEKQGAYGLQAETTGQNGDPKAENLIGGFNVANRGREHRFGRARPNSAVCRPSVFCRTARWTKTVRRRCS